MSEDRALLRKLLREHYETAVASGTDFDLDDVVAAAMADPGIAALEQAIHAEACRSGIKSIDDNRRKRDDQLTLFGDPDQVVALPDNKRRRKGSCGVREITEHLAFVTTNAAKVNAAVAREQREAGMLMPYMAGGALWEEAMAAYAADHPEDVAP